MLIQIATIAHDSDLGEIRIGSSKQANIFLVSLADLDEIDKKTAELREKMNQANGQSDLRSRS